MQSAILFYQVCLSVRLPVCSIMLVQYCVKTNRLIDRHFWRSGRGIIVVFANPITVTKLQGEPLQRGVKYKGWEIFFQISSSDYTTSKWRSADECCDLFLILARVEFRVPKGAKAKFHKILGKSSSNFRIILQTDKKQTEYITSLAAVMNTAQCPIHNIKHINI